MFSKHKPYGIRCEESFGYEEEVLSKDCAIFFRAHRGSAACFKESRKGEIQRLVDSLHILMKEMDKDIELRRYDVWMVPYRNTDMTAPIRYQLQKQKTYIFDLHIRISSDIYEWLSNLSPTVATGTTEVQFRNSALPSAKSTIKWSKTEKKMSLVNFKIWDLKWGKFTSSLISETKFQDPLGDSESKIEDPLGDFDDVNVAGQTENKEEAELDITDIRTQRLKLDDDTESKVRKLIVLRDGVTHYRCVRQYADQIIEALHTLKQNHNYMRVQKGFTDKRIDDVIQVNIA